MISRCVVIALVCLPAAVAGQSDPDVRIALSLLPVGARTGASVRVEREGGIVLAREGNGNFLCDVGDLTGRRYSVACYSREVEALRAAEREAAGRDAPSEGGDVACRLMAERGKSVPPGAMEITASGAWGPGGDRPAELTAYRLVYLPGATEASLGLTADAPDDPSVPYLHLAGTCRAHVMWAGAVAAGGR